eukprot:m.139366 g.139366  ORF g.139366 m.139366 type:complete len:59 (-) comp16653_c3_seq1:327-503(-)
MRWVGLKFHVGAILEEFTARAEAHAREARHGPWPLFIDDTPVAVLQALEAANCCSCSG